MRAVRCILPLRRPQHRRPSESQRVSPRPVLGQWVYRLRTVLLRLPRTGRHHRPARCRATCGDPKESRCLGAAMGKQLIKGNEALAKAAILAGCRAFYSYPITPASEIGETAAL